MEKYLNVNSNVSHLQPQVSDEIFFGKWLILSWYNWAETVHTHTHIFTRCGNQSESLKQ